MFIVTTEIQPQNCPFRTTQSIVQLPLGDPYDITVKTAAFAKSEFAIMLMDTGLLKEVSLNSTPQLAENLNAMAELIKAIGEATKPAPIRAEENCGEVRERIVKVEKFKLHP